MPESRENNFNIPDRRGDMTGSAFAATIMNLGPGEIRERAIFEQFELGNVPEFMRTPRRIVSEADGHRLEMDVLPDFLCVGTDDDFLRVVLWPMTLQAVADLFGATLITPHISDLIWQQADVQLDALQTTMPPTKDMVTTKWFVDQHAKVEKLRAGRTGLIAGHKKDVVLANSLMLPQFQDRVAISGWHKKDGARIQGLNPSPSMPLGRTHHRKYIDYSHGGRLMAKFMLLDGLEVLFEDVASNPLSAELVNGNDGVLRFLRYAT